MFVPKIRLFPLFYWFVNFTFTDKHGTKNLLGLIRPWTSREKKRETRNSRLENLRQNAESAEVSDIGLTSTNFMIYCFLFEAIWAVFGQAKILFAFAPADLLPGHQFPLFTIKVLSPS